MIRLTTLTPLFDLHRPLIIRLNRPSRRIQSSTSKNKAKQTPHNNHCCVAGSLSFMFEDRSVSSSKTLQKAKKLGKTTK